MKKLVVLFILLLLFGCNHQNDPVKESTDYFCRDSVDTKYEYVADTGIYYDHVYNYRYEVNETIKTVTFIADVYEDGEWTKKELFSSDIKSNSGYISVLQSKEYLYLLHYDGIDIKRYTFIVSESNTIATHYPEISYDVDKDIQYGFYGLFLTDESKFNTVSLDNYRTRNKYSQGFVLFVEFS